MTQATNNSTTLPNIIHLSRHILPYNPNMSINSPMKLYLANTSKTVSDENILKLKTL